MKRRSMATARIGVAPRLFLTVWLVFVLHFATDIVRETYLAVTLGDDLSIRVDEYVGLHPDLFVMEGRGAFINNNPGASMLAAVPYALARPAIAALFRAKPELAQPKPPAEFDETRPNRIRFFNEARARGLDIKLGLAAASMQAGLMAPLAALAAVVLFGFLRERLDDERKALWLALLYAFGTPIFFRSAFLNQNALLAHWILFAFVALAGAVAEGLPEARRARRLLAAGALLGLGILCDYSGAPLALAFGLWTVAVALKAGGVRASFRWGGWLVLGALGPLALLLGYQWAAFGNPLLPAQHYMPPTEHSVVGWNGIALPLPELLWRNLLDPRYGLFVFCPMLAAALAAPFLARRRGDPSRAELALIFGAAAVLYLFQSANQYALLQWNTGVRYLVPVVPLLFLALSPVLLRLPRFWLYALVVPTVTVSWSVSMARADVPGSLARVFLGGFELPWHTVLRRAATSYAPFLEQQSSPLAILCLGGVVLWLIWRGVPGPARGGSAPDPQRAGADRRPAAAPAVPADAGDTRG